MNALTADERGLMVACGQCGQVNRLAYERLNQLPRCGKCRGELQVPGLTLDVPSNEVFDAITTKSALPVLVDFWAAWCGPCKMIAPQLAQVAAEGAGKWIVAKVNTEEVSGPAVRLRVSAIPLLVLLKRGAEVDRHAGAMPAAEIRQFITKSR